MSWDVSHYKLCPAEVDGAALYGSTRPLWFESVSSCHQVLKQKEINPFVSEMTESACVITIIIDITMATQHYAHTYP